MEHKNSLGSRVQVRKIKGSTRFSTLFSKLVCIYMGLLSIILVMLFITFTRFFQPFFVSFVEDAMVKQAKAIASQYEKIGRYTTSKEEVASRISPYIKGICEQLDSVIWLIDREGNGYEFSAHHEMMTVGYDVMDSKMLEEVLQGNVVSYENGFLSYFSMPVLTVGYPVVIDSRQQLALFIHAPLPYVIEIIDTIRLLILRVILLVGTILFVWIYFITRDMTKPLMEMNQVAKNIASGKFGERIIVEGKDEIAQLGHSLNHMAEALDKIEENRKSFISSISHDLRSPLTSISGFVTAILDGTIDAANQERYLKIVLAEAQRMINMSNAILDLNRMQENAPIERTIFNINQMITRIIIGFEERCKAHHIHIYTDLDQQHTHVFAQADGINRVIQNLMENAYKFVGDGGDILIRTKVLYDKLWVSVYNSGPPIPKEQQQLIWERFYKGDTSRGQDKNGIGLGLVIVKEIIRSHDEEVGVHSEEGEMVEFYFSLALAKK